MGDEEGNVNVPSFDWKNFFAGYFRKIPGIKKCHQFSASSKKPGTLSGIFYSPIGRHRFHMHSAIAGFSTSVIPA